MVAVLLLSAIPFVAQDAKTSASSASPVYLTVQMDRRVRLSSLKRGDVVEGKLARDAYSAQGEVFSSGSSARLSVDHIEKRRRTDSGRWPWVVGVFTPRWQRFPVFSEARIAGVNDVVSTLPISVVKSGHEAEIVAPSSKKKGKSPGEKATDNQKSKSGPQLLLETRDWEAGPNLLSAALPVPSTDAALAAPAGTRCRILLLSEVRSSTSRANDPVRAVLLEPVVAEHQVVFPAGSVFEGSVIKAAPPRMLSRAGSISIAFLSIARPDGMKLPVASSVVGVEMDSASKARIDDEGRIHGGPPGLKWLLIDGGVSAGLAKVADDGTQLLLESIISTATDASTAGTARLAAMGVSGIFMLSRHGRDVRLPKYTEMTVTLDRPLPKQEAPAPQHESNSLRTRPVPTPASLAP